MSSVLTILSVPVSCHVRTVSQESGRTRSLVLAYVGQVHHPYWVDLVLTATRLARKTHGFVPGKRMMDNRQMVNTTLTLNTVFQV